MGRVRSLKKFNGNPPQYQMVGEGNKVFSQTNAHFQKACQLAGIPPTQRQASKWRRGFGRAWSFRIEAKQEL